MKQHFYSNIIEIDSLIIELNQMELSIDEKKYLIDLLHSNLHHAILDTILSELSEEDKKVFLTHLSGDKHDKIWNHLKEKIENVESKIKKTAEDLKKELHKNIKEIKNPRQE